MQERSVTDAPAQRTDARADSPTTAAVPGAPVSSLLDLRRAPASARREAVLSLQRSVGNRAMARALTSAPRVLVAREPPPKSANANPAYKAIAGTPFVNGVSPDDVHQGQLGDCNLLAPAMAVARVSPAAIQSLITSNGNGTYNVTLYYRDHFWWDLTAHVFTISNQLPVDQAGNLVYGQSFDVGPAGRELWVSLLEKALAKWKGSYADAEGALWDKEGLELLTGNEAIEHDPRDFTKDLSVGLVAGALRANHALTACTSTSRWKRWWLNDDEKAEIQRWDIVLDHAYSIVAADERAQTVDLKNPWGNHHISGLPWSVFRHYMYSWSEVKVT
jgi:hypothetical protein